jgi:hypothetical protein
MSASPLSAPRPLTTPGGSCRPCARADLPTADRSRGQDSESRCSGANEWSPPRIAALTGRGGVNENAGRPIERACGQRPPGLSPRTRRNRQRAENRVPGRTRIRRKAELGGHASAAGLLGRPQPQGRRHASVPKGRSVGARSGRCGTAGCGSGGASEPRYTAPSRCAPYWFDWRPGGWSVWVGPRHHALSCPLTPRPSHAW